MNAENSQVTDFAEETAGEFDFRQPEDHAARRWLGSIDNCIHDHPWSSVAVFTGLGVVAGILIADLLSD